MCPADPPPQPPPPPPPPESIFTTGPMSAPTTGRAWLRRFGRLWGFAAFLVVVAYVFREVLVPFIFAVGVAYVLAPAVDRLARLRIGRFHLPRGLAVIACYVVLLFGGAIFFVAFLPRLTDDFARLGKEAPRLWERAQNEWTPRAARWLEQQFPSLTPEAEAPPARAPGPVATELPPPPGTVLVLTPMANGDYALTLPGSGLEVERVDDKRVVVRQRVEPAQHRLEELIRARFLRLLAGLEDQVSEAIKLGQAVVVGIIAIVVQLVLVLLVAAYILVDIGRVHAFVRSVIPERYRSEYEDIVRGIDRGMNGVVRGQLIICGINGVLIYIGLVVFDVKYALLLGALAGVMSLIPIFGSVASSIPIVVFAVFGGTEIQLWRGVGALLWILGVHFLESSLLGPKIMGAAARMHPVVVLFALIAGQHSYGLVGAVLAVPVASIIQTLFIYFRSRAWRSDLVRP
jgi:predicted PurR-regulated permease PerM